MTAHRFFTLSHKWLTLFIGIQIVLWILGGFVMSFFDIDHVRGSQNVAENEPAPFTGSTALLSPSAVLAAEGLAASRITLRHMLEVPVYEVNTADGTMLFDAATGARLSPLSKETAIALAEADFAPDVPVVLVEDLAETPGEYRGGPLPAYRITFADKENTRLYVSANHGRVMARRNDTWRLYDFFWMLHIMDYKEREDFNTWWLVLASAIALFGVVSGVGLVFYRFRRRDFRWVLPKTPPGN